MAEELLNLESEEVASDLVAWLSDVNFEEYIKYFTNLNAGARRQLADLEPLCLLILRRQRLDTLVSAGYGNSTHLLTEPELLSFITALVLSDSEALLTLQKSHPGLQIDPLPAGFVESFGKVLVAWNSLFRFFTTADFLEKNLYLKSILGLNRTAAELLSISSTNAELLESMHHSIEVSNYELCLLDPLKRGKFESIIKFFSFLPHVLINENSNEVPFETYVLLQNLQIALNVIRIAVDASIDLKEIPAYEEILWDCLAKKLEIREIKARRSVAFISVDSREADLFLFFDQVFESSAVISGTGQQLLDQYLFQLTPAQKSDLAPILEDYLRTSPTILTLLDPLDIDFFISTIRTITKDETDLFLMSVQNRIIPDFWPITSKVMKMVANVYQAVY